MANFYMKEKVWDKLQNYSQYAYDEHKSEIGGMLLAEKDKDDRWKLHSPTILKQEISGGNTALSKEALASYYVKTAMKHKNRDIKFVWWHSHHTMDVFWSQTDLTAIDEMNQGDWSISLVVNLQKEYKLRVNVWKPFPAVVDDIALDIVRKEPQIPKAIVNEVEKLCTKPSTIVVRSNNNHLVNSNYRYGSQLNVFHDKAMIRFESKVDDIMLDFINGSIKYKNVKHKIKMLNFELQEHNMKVSIPPTHEELETTSCVLDAEDYFHRIYEKWSYEDKLIEKNEDADEIRYYNAAWSSNV